jgi:hypothetical protein
VWSCFLLQVINLVAVFWRRYITSGYLLHTTKRCHSPNVTLQASKLMFCTHLRMVMYDRLRPKLRFWKKHDFVIPLACFCMDNILSKNMPRFLTNDALVTIVSSKERQHSENSFTRCFGANTISSVLSWFNLSIFELIHTQMSDKQVSRRLDIFFQLTSGFITRYTWVSSA